MTTTPQAWPDWYDGRHINEVLFCQHFLDKHPMKCVRGRLFTVDGLIEDEGQIGNLILDEPACQHQAASVFTAAAHRDGPHPCCQRNVFHGRQLHRRQELLQQPPDRHL